jgi:hypothetical protein
MRFSQPVTRNVQRVLGRYHNIVRQTNMQYNRGVLVDGVLPCYGDSAHNGL